MQTGFDDINARFDDLTTRFEVLGLCANMNMGKREANAENDARGQLVIKPICANPHGQYDYEYSSNDEDLFWLMWGINKNSKEKRNVLKDLPQSRPCFRSIPKFPSRQPLVFTKGIGEDELDGGHETLSNQDKQPQSER